MDNNRRCQNSKNFLHFCSNQWCCGRMLLPFLQNTEEREITKNYVKVMATTKSTKCQGAQYAGSSSSLPALGAANQGNAPLFPRQNASFPDMCTWQQHIFKAFLALSSLVERKAARLNISSVCSSGNNIVRNQYIYRPAFV